MLEVAPGAIVGVPGAEYVLGQELAVGGFGQVFRARRRADDHPAAIKILHGFLCQDREPVRRFHREVLAARRVRHPHVVEILDLGEAAGGRPFFAMELLEGCDLRRHLEQRGALPPGEVAAILGPLADALDAAHQRGVVHRDVKPSNVFLADRVVLLDFGIAKLLEDTGPALTASRHAVGTPSAMAPEQIRGGAVDARTDVYGLGVLAFAMLTGRPPFAHRQTAALQRMHLREPPPAVSSVAAALPAALDQVLARAMAKRPDERPASAGAFRAAFVAALGA